MHQIHPTELNKLEADISLNHFKFCSPKTRLIDPDPLITIAKNVLKNCKPSYGRYPDCLYDYSKSYLSIQVTKETLSKALRAYNNFLKLAECRGHQIKVENHCTKIIIGEIDCRIRIRETYKRIKTSKNSYISYDYVPTGFICFSIDELYKKEWNDKSKALEYQWARIMAYLELRAKSEMEWKIECAKQQAQHEKKLKIQEELERKEALEKEKVTQLITEVTQWKKAELIREYIRKSKIHKIKDHDWIKWALDKANEIDPTLAMEENSKKY